MINALLTGIFNLIIGLVSVVLAPIDLLIEQFLPDLGSAFGAVNAMFGIVNNVMGFCVSVTGLSSEALSLIVLYWTFKLTAPLAVSAVKQAIKWYQALKP